MLGGVDKGKKKNTQEREGLPPAKNQESYKKKKRAGRGGLTKKLKRGKFTKKEPAILGQRKRLSDQGGRGSGF